jgi:hypothetical protein
MCSNQALSQNSNQDDDDGDDYDPRKGMPQKEADSAAKFLFSEDIKAGKLTAQKAGVFFKCAHDRYAISLLSNQKTLDAVEEGADKVLSRGSKLSAAEKEKYERAYKEAFKLQREAEDGCRNEMKIAPSVKRIFNEFTFTSK